MNAVLHAIQDQLSLILETQVSFVPTEDQLHIAPDL